MKKIELSSCKVLYIHVRFSVHVSHLEKAKNHSPFTLEGNTYCTHTFTAWHFMTWRIEIRHFVTWYCMILLLWYYVFKQYISNFTTCDFIWFCNHCFKGALWQSCFFFNFILTFHGMTLCRMTFNDIFSWHP